MLQVVHETRYDYAPPVKTAQHMAHLKPTHDAWQRLLAHELLVTPGINPRWLMPRKQMRQIPKRRI